MGSKLLPFILFSALSAVLMFRWPGFLFFAWIGASISIGNYVSGRYKKQEKQIGRKIAILLMTPVFLLFLGLMQHENLQLEETVFYLAYFIAGGVFTRVLIHYTIAKVGGPLIFGRGFCGWACWTAAHTRKQADPQKISTHPLPGLHPLPCRALYLDPGRL
jgi:ferredoxin-type protein NapH